VGAGDAKLETAWAWAAAVGVEGLGKPHPVETAVVHRQKASRTLKYRGEEAMTKGEPKAG